MIGFNTIGKPKIIGSLIPKNPGTIDKRPSCLIRFDLHTVTIRITRESVEPPPPKFVKKLLNGLVKIWQCLTGFKCHQLFCSQYVSDKVNRVRYGRTIDTEEP